MSDNLMKRNAFWFARCCWVFINAYKKPEEEFLNIIQVLNVPISKKGESDGEIFRYDDYRCWMYIVNDSIFEGLMIPDSKSGTPKFRIECKTDSWGREALDADNVEKNLVKVKQTDGELIDRYGIYLDDEELIIFKTYDFKKGGNGSIGIVSGFHQMRNDIIEMAQLYQKLVS